MQNSLLKGKLLISTCFRHFAVWVSRELYVPRQYIPPQDYIFLDSSNLLSSLLTVFPLCGHVPSLVRSCLFSPTYILDDKSPTSTVYKWLAKVYLSYRYATVVISFYFVSIHLLIVKGEAECSWSVVLHCTSTSSPAIAYFCCYTIRSLTVFLCFSLPSAAHLPLPRICLF